MRPMERRPSALAGGEDGAVAVLAIGALLIVIGFCGLALDLSRVYNRKMEMQSVADAAALVAAVELDGTKAGIARAAQKAAGLFAIPLLYGGPSFSYRQQSVTWSDSAIQFAKSPDGPWISRDTAAAKSEPNAYLFVRVDTGALDASYGEVATWFMPVVSSQLATATTAAQAVAGPTAIGVTPIGICAMGSDAKRSRTSGELEEYGFRRGVSYDLMQLNPEASDSAQSFLIHPLAAPGATGASASDFDTVAPFVCTGTMGVTRVMGGQISISSPFPLATLYQQLNSRFDSYVAPCSADTAPPDKNVKPYTFNNGSVPWMATAPEGQAARTYADPATHMRWTVAGPDPTPAGTTGVQWGPLWSYAKAVKYANPTPSTGYVAYGTANWSDLYNPGQPAAGTYPSATPYLTSGATYTKSPTHTGVRDRRVLNVALLSCPVASGKATVKGIGRFFMTVPADATHLYAEFAGLADEQTLRTRVRLYP